MSTDEKNYANEAPDLKDDVTHLDNGALSTGPVLETRYASEAVVASDRLVS